jgi:membrane protein
MEEPKQDYKKNLLTNCVEVIQNIGVKVEQVRSTLVKRPFFGFLNEVIEGMGNDGASEMVGAIAYYVILSLFPLLLGVISVLGFFLSSESVQASIILFVEDNLPAAKDLLQENIAGIIQMRGTLVVFSVLALFWSAGAMFSAISRGVNRAWGLNVRHPLIVRKLRDITMSLSACVFFYIIMTSSAVLVSFNPGGAIGSVIANMGIYALVFLMMFFIFLVIYKTMPVTKTYWRHIWPGALFAAVAFEIARIVLVFYFSYFAPRIALLYGSVAAFIIILIFAYYVSFILIVGAEISSEYSRLRQGLPPRSRKPPDLRQR